MRRYYAFEAEGVSDEVKTQLEIAEDVVEDKCETADDCDEMLEKIDNQAKKFDGALKTMSGAAKDCKDGKCDRDEMASKITPAMAELKEVAKTIGVAKEGDDGNVTESELKDVKDYLEGAKEIVEAKKDELGGKSSSSNDDDDDDDGEPVDDETQDACEAWLDYGFESYMDELDQGVDSDIIFSAMEGATMDAVGETQRCLAQIRAVKKEMNAAKKKKDWKTAAQKARAIASMGDELSNRIGQIPNSVSSAVIVNIALAVLAILAAAAVGQVVKRTAFGKKAQAKSGKKAATAVGAENRAKAQELKPTQTKLSDEEIKYAKMMGMDDYGDMKETMRAQNKARSEKNAAAYAKFQEEAKAAGNAARDAAKRKTRNIGTAIAIAAPAATGAVAGAANLMKILKGKKVVDADGNVTKTKVEPNDINVIIAATKSTARSIKEKYTKKAEEFEAKAKADSENPYRNAAESFISACEALMIGSSESRSSDNTPFFA